MSQALKLLIRTSKHIKHEATFRAKQMNAKKHQHGNGSSRSESISKHSATSQATENLKAKVKFTI